jgi:endoglucanase
MHGSTGSSSDAYAGMGLSLREPSGPYDASKYTGVAFVAKQGPGGVAAVRFKVPDANTSKEAGVCRECFNDFGVDFQLTGEWTRYVVSFADLKQQQDWGDPRPAAVDASTLYGLQWQVSSPNAPFDVWIDDVSFVGCENER